MAISPDYKPNRISIKFGKPHLVSGIRFDDRHAFRKFTLAYIVNQKSTSYKDSILATNKTVSTTNFNSPQRIMCKSLLCDYLFRHYNIEFLAPKNFGTEFT